MQYRPVSLAQRSPQWTKSTKNQAERLTRIGGYKTSHVWAVRDRFLLFMPRLRKIWIYTIFPKWICLSSSSNQSNCSCSSSCLGVGWRILLFVNDYIIPSDSFQITINILNTVHDLAFYQYKEYSSSPLRQHTYKIPFIIHVNYSSTVCWSNGIILQSNTRAKHLHMLPLILNNKRWN